MRQHGRVAWRRSRPRHPKDVAHTAANERQADIVAYRTTYFHMPALDFQDCFIIFVAYVGQAVTVNAINIWQEVAVHRICFFCSITNIRLLRQLPLFYFNTYTWTADEPLLYTKNRHLGTESYCFYASLHVFCYVMRAITHYDFSICQIFCGISSMTFFWYLIF